MKTEEQARRELFHEVASKRLYDLTQYDIQSPYESRETERAWRDFNATLDALRVNLRDGRP